MNISGIGTTYYPAGYETKKAEQNVTGGNFARQAAEAAQAAGTAPVVSYMEQRKEQGILRYSQERRL